MDPTPPDETKIPAQGSQGESPPRAQHWVLIASIVFGSIAVIATFSSGTFLITRFASDEKEKASQIRHETDKMLIETKDRKLEEVQEQLRVVQDALALEENRRQRRSFDMIRLGPEGHVDRAFREFVREAHVGVFFAIITLQNRTYWNLAEDHLFDVRSVKKQVDQLLSWCDSFLHDAEILDDYPETEIDEQTVVRVKSHRKELMDFVSRLAGMPSEETIVPELFRDELNQSIRAVNLDLQVKMQTILESIIQ